MSQQWGLLILCAKSREAADWMKMARDAKREHHIVQVTPHGPFSFNWLDYESKRPGGGGQTENLVHLISHVLNTIIEGREDSGNYDPFWQKSARLLIRQAVDLLIVAKPHASITLEDIYRMIIDAPSTSEEVRSPDWQARSYTAQIIRAADERQDKTPMQAHNVEVATRYFLQELASMADRTKSSILATLTATISPMMTGVLHHLFGTTTTFVPENIYDGAIIIVDVSIVEYGEIARIAGMLLKLMTQRALLRRDISLHPRPCAIIVDESQNFAAPGFDHEFAAMSRGVRATSIYATQSLQNYYAKLGGANSDAAVKALLAQFTTQIFCRNADVHTNNFAADLATKQFTLMTGTSTNQQSTSVNTSTALHHQIQPGEFPKLRNGGPENSLEVDAILIGRIWKATGTTFLKTTFRQQ